MVKSSLNFPCLSARGGKRETKSPHFVVRARSQLRDRAGELYCTTTHVKEEKEDLMQSDPTTTAPQPTTNLAPLFHHGPATCSIDPCPFPSLHYYIFSLSACLSAACMLLLPVKRYSILFPLVFPSPPSQREGEKPFDLIYIPPSPHSTDSAGRLSKREMGVSPPSLSPSAQPIIVCSTISERADGASKCWTLKRKARQRKC